MSWINKVLLLYSILFYALLSSPLPSKAWIVSAIETNKDKEIKVKLIKMVHLVIVVSRKLLSCCVVVTKDTVYFQRL